MKKGSHLKFAMGATLQRYATDSKSLSAQNRNFL